jgi:hypothetical protein
MLLWQARQRNETKVIENYSPEVEEVTIPRPQAKVTKRKLFTFLDEDENE